MEPWSVLWSNCKSKEGRGSPLQQTDRAKGTTQHQGGHDMRQPRPNPTISVVRAVWWGPHQKGPPLPAAPSPCHPLLKSAVGEWRRGDCDACCRSRSSSQWVWMDAGWRRDGWMDMDWVCKAVVGYGQAWYMEVNGGGSGCRNGRSGCPLSGRVPCATHHGHGIVICSMQSVCSRPSGRPVQPGSLLRLVLMVLVAAAQEAGAWRRHMKRVSVVSPTCRRQGQPFSPIVPSLSPSAWTCTTHNFTHTLPYTGPQTSNLATEKKQYHPAFGVSCRTPSVVLHTIICPSHVCCPGHQTSYSICRAMATIDPSPLCLTHPSRRPRTVSANKLTDWPEP
ncbi:hypothetical protein COCCADRAFT_34429 [Bipolaris zeicola 26-R-13]|uniref:Uncharacterized protein n=1 Tax=Cochliobolus carbonum (strain 26-R-13) TaxID=930089 RepID=W6YKF6_COCC2|nr:uncharacterized protein COCCADRAFT_34429 [Bipolaris zeicola 26-R-13]EUC36144.1 hypothetical protein COCCADRAFT_34429 [Bipolaris zeicola 26-R-13]